MAALSSDNSIHVALATENLARAFTGGAWMPTATIRTLIAYNRPFELAEDVVSTMEPSRMNPLKFPIA
jgi:hypothetical protein